MIEAILAILFIVAIIAAAFVYNTLSWGFVLVTLWSWFVLPLFPSMPHLTFIQAIGLTIVIGAFIPKHSISIKKEYREGKYELIGSLLSPWITLVFAWFLHLFY